MSVAVLKTKTNKNNIEIILIKAQYGYRILYQDNLGNACKFNFSNPKTPAKNRMRALKKYDEFDNLSSIEVAKKRTKNTSL